MATRNSDDRDEPDAIHRTDGVDEVDEHWGARWPYHSAAGALCLEFANTLGYRSVVPSQEEDLRDYADLLTWAERMGVLSAARVTALRAWAGTHARDADAVFTRAIALRELLYGVFAAVAASDAPASDDLAHLNAAYRNAMVHAEVLATTEGFAWGWDDALDAPDAMLWPVARGAAELLVAPERARLRHCAAPDCSWLFLDTTKNGSRHWCSMRGCGNRAKARRFRARQHGEAGAADI